MAATTILHEYERRLDTRVARGEISPDTHHAYLNGASRVFEVLLKHIPASVIEGYMEAQGYQGSYKHIIEELRAPAREPGHSAFRLE